MIVSDGKWVRTKGADTQPSMGCIRESLVADASAVAGGNIFGWSLSLT
jgi:hypothetical protein